MPNNFGKSRFTLEKFGSGCGMRKINKIYFNQALHFRVKNVIIVAQGTDLHP
jgi:hypothetical protein